MKYGRFHLPTREHRITTLWKSISDDIAAAQTLQCTKCTHIYIIYTSWNSNESYESRTVEYTLGLAVTYILYYYILRAERRKQNRKKILPVSHIHILCLYIIMRVWQPVVCFFSAARPTQKIHQPLTIETFIIYITVFRSIRSHIFT